MATSGHELWGLGQESGVLAASLCLVLMDAQLSRPLDRDALPPPPHEEGWQGRKSYARAHPGKLICPSQGSDLLAKDEKPLSV